MEIIAKISKNDYLTGIRVFKKEDALSREEIVEAVDKAAEAAENDGFRGTYVDLPEKYLEMYGVSAFDYPIVDFEDYTIGETEAEKKGLHEACCGDCNAYESGTCCKWGGTCDPNDVEFDCIHGDEIYTIIVGIMGGIEWFAAFAVIPIIMYNGRRGKQTKVMQYGFYIFYPAHLLILAAVHVFFF